ncbi:MAG TPA: YqaA family protein [Phycisphaerales bacterium]|nr:YqaA family protein [Phycisphaerales bacterium]HMP36173.1 YqaA family protein [Phycisphaerales bacterium]
MSRPRDASPDSDALGAGTPTAMIEPIEGPRAAPSPEATGKATGIPACVAAGPAPHALPDLRPPVPRWAYHRRLYDWTLSLAHRRHATTALFLVAVMESSFFPIPPDVLQIALSLERRSRAWWYATVSTVGSVLGGVLGYLIGWGMWHLVEGFFFRFIISQANFELVRGKYESNALEAVFLAAFTPIPYKVFTVAAGVFSVSLLALVIGSALGRGLRFFGVAALMYFFGPPVKRLIDRYFNLACLVVGVVAVLGIMAIKWMR